MHLATHDATAASGFDRISSASTFVSRTSIVVASVEARRLAHRRAKRQLQFHATVWRETFVDEGSQVFRLGFPADRLAQDQTRFFFQRTALPAARARSWVFTSSSRRPIVMLAM